MFAEVSQKNAPMARFMEPFVAEKRNRTIVELRGNQVEDLRMSRQVVLIEPEATFQVNFLSSMRVSC
jgi:hypothetical protein